MVDEESQSLRPAEQTLYKRLSAQLDSNPTRGLSLTTKDGNGNPPPKDQGPAFTVSHYAGQVCLYCRKCVLARGLKFAVKCSRPAYDVSDTHSSVRYMKTHMTKITRLPSCRSCMNKCLHCNGSGINRT